MLWQHYPISPHLLPSLTGNWCAQKPVRLTTQLLNIEQPYDPAILLLGTYLAAAAKSLQSCPTLCNSIDGSPSGSSVPGILQARTLEWVAISFSNAWKWKVKVKSLSHVWLLATPGTAAYQAPPSMGLSRQEYWSGVPLPSPNLPLRNYILLGFVIASKKNIHKNLYRLLKHSFLSQQWSV